MVYRAIGVMSGSSLDGIDIVFAALEERAGKWSFEILAADCIAYNKSWVEKLKHAPVLNALDYLLLHSDYGKLTGEYINAFINKYNLHHQVQLIACHGHTVFHLPLNSMTAQLGSGAAVAAATGINVVSDLRAMDVALGGQGAPIVPLGEKLLMPGYAFYLNLGGIANIAVHLKEKPLAFDICPANRVLNMLAEKENKPYDDCGRMAQTGSIHPGLFAQLNTQPYYRQSWPKSLANDFGIHVLFPMIESFHLPLKDALCTFSAHIVQQVLEAVKKFGDEARQQKMLITGGGAFNSFLIVSLKKALADMEIEVEVPDEKLVKFKEALIMSLLAVLRWREEDTVLHSVTGASRSSIGGAVWIGQQA